MFTNDTFSKVFEFCFRCQELIFHNWKIQIDDTFKLNSKIQYLIERLDLYKSLREESDDYMNSATFPQLLRAIQETKLMNSIKEIHVIDDESFYPPKKIQSIFMIYSYRFQLIADKNEPALDA